MHALDEEEAEYDPAAQEEHTVDDAIEYCPTAQMPVTAVSAAVTQYDPAGQIMQIDDPEVDW